MRQTRYKKPFVKKTIPRQEQYDSYFDDCCAEIMRHNPKANRITLFCYGKLPIAGKKIIRKGRWHYFKWGKRLIYIKEVYFKPPKDFLEATYSRVMISPFEMHPFDPKTIKKIPIYSELPHISDCKIEWTVVDWEKIE